MINIPKGTKDVLPSEAYKWHFVENTARKVAALYNLHEIRTPTFEHTELFLRGVGDTTDIVNKEMYTFLDKGDRSITLKPEGTAGVVRSFIENGLASGVLPLKMYYITPVFRYERPQAGRLREHHQFGVEFVGSKSPLAEVEVISLAAALIRKLGLKDVKLHINSIGCPNCKKDYNEALLSYLRKHEDALCPTCRERMQKNPMRVIDCKVPECREIIKDAPRTIDYLDEECRTHFEELQKLLTELEIPFEVDTGIVRGLDYYTKTVFEFVNSEGFTLCGGGRYDGLIHEIDEKHDIPSVGFGMGIERILYFLEKEGVEVPAMETPDLYVGILGADARARAYKLVNEIRSHGLIVETDYMDRSVKAQMKYANKIGAKKVVIIGADELEKGTANVKDMATGEQTEVSLNELPALF